MKLLLWTEVDFDSGCWNFSGPKDVYGYGYLDNKQGNRQAKAHRVSYETLRAPIPEGLVLDHLCRNRACVNPDHLEPVTIGENVKRKPVKEFCSRGHSDWVYRKGGNRRCRTCEREAARRRYKERKAQCSQDS